MEQELELVLKCQAGELRFFGELYELNAKKIFDFIYYRTRHKQTAEDLASQTFFKALDKLAGFSPKKGKFSSWLYQIAKNCVIDFYRSNHPTEDIESVWDLASGSSPERDAEMAIALEKLGGYLQNLSRQQREILLMRLWDGLSFKDIAEILNLGESNCKMILCRTLQKIQKDLPLVLILLLLIK
jgi:RNA polymerase sigma-70 factor (ECF subfamily)